MNLISGRRAVLLSLFLAAIGLVLVFVFASASMLPKPASSANLLPLVPQRQQRYTAIMSAFAPEISAVLQGMTVETSRTVMGTTYYFATYPETPGRHYLVFQTNVSMVNAAAAVQKTIMLFPLDRLVFSGIAGGVDDRLNIGDVVAPLKWIEYQENILGREVSGTYTINPWQYSPFPNYKERFIAQVDLGSQGPVTWFDVPQYMIEAARNVSVTLESCTTSNICLEKKPKFFVGGLGGSSQSFLDNAEFREYLWNQVTITNTTPYTYFGEMTTTLHLDVIDMESASAAQVCRMNGVDCFFFRSLSDLAGGGPGENEMNTFFQLAANNSAKVMLAYLKELP